MSLFDGRDCVYLRHPDGDGTEEIGAMAAAGFTVLMFNVRDVGFDLQPWQNQITRCAQLNVPWVPWAHCMSVPDLDRLRALAVDAAARQGFARPAACFNVEKELDPAVGAPVPLQEVIRAAAGCDVNFSTTPWPYDGVPYANMPQDWHVDLQLFPAENDTSRRPRDCRARMLERGVVSHLRLMAGIHDTTPDALPYPRRGLHSMYCCDDVGGGVNADFDRWSSGTLVRVPEAKFPYKGPFKAATLSAPPSRHPGVIPVKRALHRAGYGNFDSPDMAWNKKAANALRALQRDVGVPASGNYGRGSWMELRRLASANPGETHAIQ